MKEEILIGICMLEGILMIALALSYALGG